MTADTDVNMLIAARVRGLRGTLSLDELARRSGVSRSMISLIERGESSPTAVVLKKLATGLGISLAALFEFSNNAAEGPLMRHADQPVWRDPGSGYLRRTVSPPGISQPFRIVDVTFPAGKRVAFDGALNDGRIGQQVWILAGAMDITVGDERHKLRQGDCLAMQLDQPIVFHNPTSKPARYAVVVSSESASRR